MEVTAKGYTASRSLTHRRYQDRNLNGLRRSEASPAEVPPATLSLKLVGITYSEGMAAQLVVIIGSRAWVVICC